MKGMTNKFALRREDVFNRINRVDTKINLEHSLTNNKMKKKLTPIIPRREPSVKSTQFLEMDLMEKVIDELKEDSYHRREKEKR